MREDESYDVLEETNDEHVNERDLHKKAKPHVVRRNIEDYLEKKALKQRLKEVFDADFEL